MAFNIVLPVIAFILFYSAIGRPINGLRLAVVNEESSCCEDLLKDLHCIGSGAELLALILGGEAEMFGEDISCHVVKELDPKVFSSIKVMSLEEAEEAVVLAEANAMIRFQEGFSASLAARLRTVLTSESIKESQIDLSTIKVKMDATNSEVARAVKIAVFKSVYGFFGTYAEKCRLGPTAEALFSRGISFEMANIKTDGGNELYKAMIPGFAVVILNLLALGLCADQLVGEKVDGLLVRDYVCGVPAYLYLMAQMLIQLIVVGFQILFSLAFIAAIFPDISFHILASVGIAYLVQSICGMALGLFITSISKERDQAIQMGSAFVFPSFILSGIIWPRIAMPHVLQVISVFLPATLACDFVRSAVLRDELTNLEASTSLLAFLIPIVWGVAFFSAALFTIQRFRI